MVWDGNVGLDGEMILFHPCPDLFQNAINPSVFRDFIEATFALAKTMFGLMFGIFANE